MLPTIISNNEHYISIFSDFYAIFWIFFGWLANMAMRPRPSKCSPILLPRGLLIFWTKTVDTSNCYRDTLGTFDLCCSPLDRIPQIKGRIWFLQYLCIYQSHLPIEYVCALNGMDGITFGQQGDWWMDLNNCSHGYQYTCGLIPAFL